MKYDARIVLTMAYVLELDGSKVVVWVWDMNGKDDHGDDEDEEWREPLDEERFVIEDDLVR